MNKNKYGILIALICFSLFSFAQTNFRSNGTGGGAWNAIGTWQVESPNGSNNWVAAASTPSSASNTIEIRSSDVVSVTANITIDQTTIDAGATITLVSGTLKLANLANALVVNGTLIGNGGLITVPAAADLFISGTYKNSVNGGAVPNATWNTNSTCLINGITNTTVAGTLSPASGFYNFTWNCPSQTLDLALSIKKVNGTLSVLSTNGHAVNLTTSTINFVVINSGTTLGAPPILTLTGNITNSGTFSSGSNSVVFSGASAQKISGLSIIFYDVTVNNASGVSINSGSGVQTVSDKLTLTSGLFTTNGLLNMSSGATVARAASGILSTTPSGGLWNVTYSGATSFTTGSEIPASGILNGLTMATGGAAIVTLNNNLIIGANGFTMTSGKFKSGSFTIATSKFTMTGGTFTAPSSTLTLIGDITINGGTYTHNSGVLELSGSGMQNFTGTKVGNANYYSIKIDPSANLVAPATLNIAKDLTINGIFTAGTNKVNFNGALAGSVSGANAQFYDLAIAAKSAYTLNINSAQTINNSLTLTSGKLVNNSNNLTVNSSATITRSAGTITLFPPSGSGWGLVYTGGTKSTGLEVPASGNVSSITISSNKNSVITQTQNIIVTNSLLNSDITTYSCGTKNLSVGSLSNNGIFNAPTASATTGLTLLGVMDNNGTFNNKGGTVIMGGPTSITGTIPVFNNVTINSSGSFTAPSDITIQGNLKNDGTFIPGSGNVKFSGNAAKQIGGSKKITFNNLIVVGGTAATDLILENTAGADISGILSFDETVPAVFDTDGAVGNRIFTLLSSSDKPTADASIAILLTTINPPPELPGKINVQRFMNRSGVAAYNFQVWRDISAPVNSDVADLQQSIPVTGPFGGATQTVPGPVDASHSSLQQYSDPTSDVNADGKINMNDGWLDFPVLVNTEHFTGGQGYSVFIFGTDSELLTPGSDLWSLTGQINGGNISPQVVYKTATGKSAGNTGWNLVGNPYPSTIDWTAIPAASRPNISNAIYIDDYSTATPKFASWVNGVSANGGTPYIAMGQGFWVKASAASPSLALTESIKKPGQQTTFFRQSTTPNLIRVTLASADQATDETVIYFPETATSGFDNEFDAFKLLNRGGHMNLSSMSTGNENYAINGLPFLNCNQPVNLNVGDVRTGKYDLLFSEFESMPKEMSIILVDNLSNTNTDVRLNQKYSFEVDSSIPSTFGANRFTVLFTYNGTPVSVSAQGMDVCESAQASITVAGSSSDVYYSVISKDGSVVVPATLGTSNNLALSLSGYNLQTGVNQFTVKGVNKFCSALMESTSVSFNYQEKPSGPSVTSSISCGVGTVTLTASGAPSDGRYNWYDSKDNIDAHANHNVSFVTSTLAKSRIYYVSAVNNMGCEGERTAVVASVINLEPAEIINSDLNILQSNYDSGNQWYLNGEVIHGATDKVLKVNYSGTYGLTVSSLGCSVSTSKEIVANTALESSSSINVYPNPVKGILNVEVDGSEKISGEILNAVGQTFQMLDFNFNGQMQIAKHNFATLATGVYFVKVSHGNRVTVVRVVKD